MSTTGKFSFMYSKSVTILQIIESAITLLINVKGFCLIKRRIRNHNYLINSLAFSCKYSLVCGRIKLLPNNSKKSSHFSVSSKDSLCKRQVNARPFIICRTDVIYQAEVVLDMACPVKNGFLQELSELS